MRNYTSRNGSCRFIGDIVEETKFFLDFSDAKWLRGHMLDAYRLLS